MISGFLQLLLRSDSAGYLAGTKTTGAGVDVGRLSVDDRFDALHVGLECAVGAPMRVGDFDSKADFLSANFTFCHLLHLLLVYCHDDYLNKSGFKMQVLFEQVRLFFYRTVDIMKTQFRQEPEIHVSGRYRIG